MEPEPKRPHIAKNSQFDSNGLSVRIPPRNIAHTTPDQIFKFTFDNMKKSNSPSPRSAPPSDGSNALRLLQQQQQQQQKQKQQQQQKQQQSTPQNQDNSSDMIFYYPSQAPSMASSAKSMSTPFSYGMLQESFQQQTPSSAPSFQNKIPPTPGSFSMNDLLSPHLLMMQTPHNQHAMFSLLQAHEDSSSSPTVPTTPASYTQSLPTTPATLTSTQSNSSILPPTTLLESEVATAKMEEDKKRKKRTRTVKLDADTVVWLKSNFEMYPGRTVERSVVYQAYAKHMETLMKSPCNPAGFGKTIRMVFKGVQSRRLGARGQSRYHYDGIRIKPSSAIAMMEMAQEGERMLRGDDDGKGKESKTSMDKKMTVGDPTLSAAALMMLARSVDKALNLPTFPPLTEDDFGNEDIPKGLTRQLLGSKAQALTELYLNHCKQILTHVKNVHFSQAYAAIHSFWESFPISLEPLLSLEPTAMKVQLWDTILYDTIVHVIIPEVLRPLGKNAKTCIKSLCEDIASSVKALSDNIKCDVPSNIIDAKVTATGVYQDILDRRLSLNNLAHVGVRLLESESQMKAMGADVAKINLRSIKRQSQWVTACDEEFVEDIMNEFSTFLSTSRTLGLASEWLDGIVRRCFKEYAGVDVDELAGEDQSDIGKVATPAPSSSSSSEQTSSNGDVSAKHNTTQEKVAALHKSGRKFLLAWNFYTSQIVRDFSLRSATTFGTCNILRLLFDEYMNYLVHTRITHPHKRIIHPKVIVRTEKTHVKKSNV